MMTVFAVQYSVGMLCAETMKGSQGFMHQALADAQKRVVGTKQLLRALDEGKIAHVYIAKDADLLLTKRVADRCYDMNIPCTQVETMAELGRACAIDVKAAAAGLYK